MVTRQFQAQWLNNTIDIDTGCVFGGKLTALRYPEQELVEVPAMKVWCEPAKPLALGSLTPSSLSSQQINDDLLDADDGLAVLAPLFRDFGGRARFEGRVRTCHAPRDNSQVRSLLEQPGEGCVLVVEGEGSLDCALLGDQLGELAVRNGWSGLVIHGCVRDSAVLGQLDLGVRALAAMPRKSVKRGLGAADLDLEFAGVRIVPGSYLVADEDGIVVCKARPQSA